MRAMLARTLQPPRQEQVLKQAEWILEPKYDGVRAMVHVDEKSVTWKNRNDEPLTKPIPKFVSASLELPGQFILDGEIVGKLFYVFDLPYFGIDLTARSAIDRRLLLERLVPVIDCSRIRLTPQTIGSKKKRAMQSRARKEGWEGVMFRHADAPYTPGKRSDYLLKWKFERTVDCIVSDTWQDGKENAVLTLLDEGALIEVGRCSLVGKGDVEPGDVIEVRYLHANDGVLVQPRMIRTRPDKDPHDCRVDQLDSAKMLKQPEQPEDVDSF